MILPGLILGPVMGPDYSGPVDLITQMLQGKMPAVPRIGFGIVDVRGLAALHVSAMRHLKPPGSVFWQWASFSG